MVLEEVDLHGAVGKVHHHGPTRPEPGFQSRNTRQLVLLAYLNMNFNYTLTLVMNCNNAKLIEQILFYLHVSSGFEEMLSHVVLKVVEEFHLLLHISRELVHCVVMLKTIKTLIKN